MNEFICNHVKAGKEIFAKFILYGKYYKLCYNCYINAIYKNERNK
ncbi:MAG: hypothetical protein QXX78_06910 [Nitrososphaerota archaeon]